MVKLENSPPLQYDGHTLTFLLEIHECIMFREDSRKIMGPEGACDGTVSITHFLRKLLALSHFADGCTISGR